ncbi:MAG: insulinase family protein, partial [Chitinophagaceae bacterium]
MNTKTGVGSLLLISTVMSVSAQRTTARNSQASGKRDVGIAIVQAKYQAPAGTGPSGFIKSQAAAGTAVLPDTSAINATAHSPSDSVTVQLQSSFPPPGSITEDVPLDAIGASLLTLGNGVRVILKPTKFQPGQVIFHAFSPGGSSLYDDNNYQSASHASDFINRSGLANLDASQFSRFMEGSQLEVNTYIEERMEGLAGHNATSEMEKALQLIHLSFTSPRKDTAVFRETLNQYHLVLEEAQRNAMSSFNDSASAWLWNYNPRRSRLTPAKVNQLNLDRMFKIYNDRFGDASDFVFVFVGNFDKATIRPLLENYLGSLPGTGRQETPRDYAVRIPPGRIRK